MKNERNYGIDLLRIVLMYMVCILHTLGCGGVLAACTEGTTPHKVFWLLEILSYCAVDAFALISGYTATDKMRKFEKLADMWFQAFFYSFVITAILTIAGLNPGWNVKGLIKSALPVTFGVFWYFTAFFALFFAIPVLNRFVFAVDEKAARRAILLLMTLFSGMELLAGAFNTQGGYSALWLMVLYCVGVLAKQGRVFERRHSLTLIAVWIVCVLITWFVQVFIGSGRLTSYVSPTIVASGLIMVILFSRLRLKGTVVEKLSPLVFGIYLFQLNPVIWNTCLQGRASFAAQAGIAAGVRYVFTIAGGIFLSGLLVEFVRSRLAKVMRIPVFSQKIVALVQWVLRKVLIVLN